MAKFGPVLLPSRARQIRQVAVGFCRHLIQNRICSHAVIIYRPDQTKDFLKVIDLGGDGEVNSSPVNLKDCKYSWVVPECSEFFLTHLAWLCESLSKDTPQIGYWVEYNPEIDFLYSKEGTILIGNDSVGLTCSTFVLAVFALARVTLLKFAEWQNVPPLRKEEDDEHQQFLMDLLQHNPSVYALRQTRGDRIPCTRYSPEDVIGACRVPQSGPVFSPVGFFEADAAGKEVRHWTDAINAMV